MKLSRLLENSFPGSKEEMTSEARNFLVDFDNRSRQRKLVLQFLGEK